MTKGACGMTLLSFAILATLSSLLSFTNTPAQAEEANSDLNLTISSVLSLSITSPCETTTNSPNLTLDIMPTQSGVVSTCPHIIRVDSNTPGYSLSFKTSNSNLTHTSIPGETVASTDNNTTPAQLDLNSWGFALPTASDITLSGYAPFDNTYTQRTNSPYATTTDKYATTPITNTELKHLTTGNHNENTVVSDDQTTIYYGAAIDFNTIAGQYKTIITYTAIGESIPCQWNPDISFEGLECKELAYMQDFTTTDCQALGGDTPLNTTTDYTPYTTTLTDKRDGTEYRIRKLADGKCWMIDNLKLELGHQDDTNPTKDTRILEPSNTNVENNTPIYFTQDGTSAGQALTGMTDNFTTSGHNTRNGDSSITSPNLDAWRQNNPNDPNMSNSANCQNNTSTDSNNGNVSYNTNSKTGCGYLYNYYTATAGSAAQADYSNGKGAGYIALQSICPSGWKLPTGQYNGDFSNLDQYYNGNGDYHNDDVISLGLWLSAGAWQGAFSGGYSSGLYGQGSHGDYWSSSVSSAYNARDTLFYSNVVNPGTLIPSRRDGFAARCLVGS
jgi:uncharacterized protein (TIGR02145 family)